MRNLKFLICAATLFAAAACEDDPGVTDLGTPAAAASVRFVNAVVDTGTVDLRFIDKVENLPMFLGVAPRASSGFYQRVEPGSRSARIFPNATDPALTQIFLVDTNVSLNASTRYTLVYAGRARAGAPAGERARLAVIEDPATPPTPPANSIALQVLNLFLGTVNVYVVPVASLTAATPADFATNNVAVFRNVNFLGKAAAYVNVAARPTSGTPFYRFVVTEPSSTTALFAATPNQPGVAAPAGASYGPQPGVRIAGSVLTAVVAPGTTPGSRQSTAATQTPTVFLLIDKVLNPS